MDSLTERLKKRIDLGVNNVGWPVWNSIDQEIVAWKKEQISSLKDSLLGLGIKVTARDASALDIYDKIEKAFELEISEPEICGKWVYGFQSPGYYCNNNKPCPDPYHKESDKPKKKPLPSERICELAGIEPNTVYTDNAYIFNMLNGIKAYLDETAE